MADMWPRETVRLLKLVMGRVGRGMWLVVSTRSRMGEEGPRCGDGTRLAWLHGAYSG